MKDEKHMKGARFKAMKAKMAKAKAKPASDEGKKKYGKADFAEMAARARMKKAK